MKGYKTIKQPTPDDIIQAAIKVSYMATILTSAQAAADKVGDAAYLHDIYNTVDEVAAMNYAAEIGQPKDTFSSRRQADGSKSEFPEDVLAARKRRSPEASRAIDAKALDIWHKYRLKHQRSYPYFAIVDIATGYVNAHCFLGDTIGQEINRTDILAGEADESVYPHAKGNPSANLVSWLTAVFLTVHDKYYKTLLKEWIAYIDYQTTQTRQALEHLRIDGTITGAFANCLAERVPTYARHLYARHPEIKRDFFKLLDDYFTFHFNNKEALNSEDAPTFELTFNAFIEQYSAIAIFVPNITEDTYRRYKGK